MGDYKFKFGRVQLKSSLYFTPTVFFLRPMPHGMGLGVSTKNRNRRVSGKRVKFPTDK